MALAGLATDQGRVGALGTWRSSWQHTAQVRHSMVLHALPGVLPGAAPDRSCTRTQVTVAAPASVTADAGEGRADASGTGMSGPKRSRPKLPWASASQAAPSTTQGKRPSSFAPAHAAPDQLAPSANVLAGYGEAGFRARTGSAAAATDSNDAVVGSTSRAGDSQHQGRTRSRTLLQRRRADDSRCGLVRTARSWKDVREILDQAHGTPTPRMQLRLLLQSRGFGAVGAAGNSDAGGACGGGVGKPQGPDGLRGRRRGCGGGRPQFQKALPALPVDVAETEEMGPVRQPVRQRGPLGPHQAAALGHGQERPETTNSAAQASDGTVEAAGGQAKLTVAEGVRGAEEWELDSSAWERRQAGASAALGAQLAKSARIGGRGARPTAAPQPSPRLPLEALPPGHAAAAAPASVPTSGLRFIPIAPLRASPPPQPHLDSTMAGSGDPAPQSGRQGRGPLGRPGAGCPPNCPPHVLRTASGAATLTVAPIDHIGGGRGGGGTHTTARADAPLVAGLLARIVHDASVVQPAAWTDMQVAALLRCAAKLSYRYPGLLQEPSPPSSFLSPMLQTQCEAIMATAPVCGSGRARHSDAIGDGAAAAGSTADTVVQLRVQLQQLLLRLDGMLDVPRPGGKARQLTYRKPARATGPDNSAATAAAAAHQTCSSLMDKHAAQHAPQRPSAFECREMRTTAGAAAGSQDRRARARATLRARAVAAAATAHVRDLPPAAAAAALWGAAALRLRLSPSGRVRLRVMAAFRRPRRGQGHGGVRRAAPRSMRIRVGARCSARLPALQGHALVDALWGMAKLGIQVPMPWLDAALRSLAATRPATHSAAVPSSSRPAHPATAGRASPAVSGASAAADGVGGGGDGGGGDTSGGGSGLDVLIASQLANVAWAVVELRSAAGRDDVTRKWAAVLFAASQRRLAQLTPSQLVDLLWSIGRGRRRPTGPWRTAAAAALAAAAPRLAPWQVARVAAALAKLRLPFPYQVVAALLAALRSRLSSGSPADVAAMVWSLPYITPPYTQPFVRTHLRDLCDLVVATQPCLPGLPPAQLVQLVDGFARLGLLPDAEWMRAHREACIALRDQFTEPNRRKVRQAYALIMQIRYRGATAEASPRGRS